MAGTAGIVKGLTVLRRNVKTLLVEGAEEDEEDEEEEEAEEVEEAEEMSGVGENRSSSNKFHASISTISINGGAPAKSKSKSDRLCRAVSENGKVENNVISVMPLSGTNPASDN